MVKYSHYCLLCLCGNRVSRYILILAKLKGRGRPFLKGAKREATLWHYPQEHLVVIRDEKVSFCEIWDNPTPSLFLVEPLTSKHCRTWIKLDMINLNLWIDSVHWVINPPPSHLKNTTCSFLPRPLPSPLKSANCSSPLFLRQFPLSFGFSWPCPPSLKIGFFTELPWY